MDIGGCVNVLVPGRLIGDKVPGMAPNSALLDICKYEGDLPDSQLFEGKLDAVALDADPDTALCREIIEGHGFEKTQEKVKASYLRKGALAK
jgi:trimethylamine-N-oxide reductase (cytochrome c)